MKKKWDDTTRIAIVGAGAAGLAAAYYLKKQRYRHVMVFEELGHVGGLCRTITDGYESFDLGANYITPAYHETKKIAKAVGAETIKAHQYVGARIKGKGKDKKLEYESMFNLVREDPGDSTDSTKRIGLFALGWAALRFFWLRLKLRSAIDQPTLARVHEHPDLCVSFDQWLRDNRLDAVRRLFEVPITTFGYGFLDEIAAPYALRYIHPLTYFAMLWRGIPGLRRIAPWPKRFKHGFQRLWERVAWDLNVRLDVKITEIRRNLDAHHPIRIRLERKERVMDDHVTRNDELFFDRLIIACPLTPKVLRRLGLDLTDTELDLFDKVKPYSYGHRIVHCVHKAGDKAGETFLLKEPVVIVFPFSDKTVGKPWAAVQYWKEQSPLIQLYTRTCTRSHEEIPQRSVEQAEEELLELMGARVAGDLDPCNGRWKSFTRWPYFGHVTPEDMSKGFFWELERLQGQNDTFYVGGATDFELIEPIVQYAKHLVGTHFPAHPQ